MEIFKKNINTNEILEIVNKKNYLSRIFMMTFGMLLIAIGFNIFNQPFNLVPGGVGGLSLVMAKVTNLSPSSLIYIINAVLLYLSLFFLGPKFTMKTFVVSMMFPFFIDLTAFLRDYIIIGHDKIVLVTIYSGLMSGIGTGIVYKAGFNTGGSDILKHILMKKTKIPIGKAIFIIDGLIVVLGTLVFRDPMIFMYSIIVIYVAGFTVERILLGISNSKAFYIISQHNDDIIHFANKELSVKATILKAHGSLHHSEHDMLILIVPTKDYYLLKEAIIAIDKAAFFTIIDVYQTYGLEERLLSSKKQHLK